MNRIYTIVAIAILSILTTGCKDKQSAQIDITGTWELTDILTKSAIIGDQTIEVILIFNHDNTMSIDQKLGEGRHHSYTGTWSLDANKLSGKYSDGSSWGAVYTVSVNGDQLTMLPSDKEYPETYIYQRK